MKHTVEVTRKIEVTTDDIVCILSCEAAGWDYWGCIVDCDNNDKVYKAAAKRLHEKGGQVSYEDVYADALEHGEKIIIGDVESEDEWELTLEKLLNGIKQNAAERPEDCSIEDGDAITADCILQYALFGEVVFG